MPFPDSGLVFDYALDDGGASLLEDDDEEIKDRKVMLLKFLIADAEKFKSYDTDSKRFLSYYR